MIKFTKTYPDFTFMPHCCTLVQSVPDASYWLYLFYIAYFLNSLPGGSKVVYAGPARGKSLIGLASFLQRHHVILIDNFCMLPEGYQTPDEVRVTLKENINRCQLPSLEFIEKSFEEVWTSLKDVDFLLLDGPPTISDLTPFSDSFIFMMHDINGRLKGGSWKLDGYLPYLCRIDDASNLERLNSAPIDQSYKQLHDEFYRDQSACEYGPHAWFIGKK